MLGKLLKYDFKAVGRIMLPMYAAMMVLGIVIGVTARIETGGKTLLSIWMLLFFLLVMAAVILTVYLLVERYYRSLLGNEGYLNCALPVTTLEHIASKVIAALVWMIFGCLAVAVSGLLMGLISTDWQDLVEAAQFIGQRLLHLADNAEALLLFVKLFVIAVLSLTMMVMMVYAAIAVGHLWSEHHILGTIIAFVAFQIVMTIVVMVFDKTGVAIHFAKMTGVVCYTVFWLAVYGTLTWYILDRHLNLE